MSEQTENLRERLRAIQSRDHGRLVAAMYTDHPEDCDSGAYLFECYQCDFHNVDRSWPGMCPQCAGRSYVVTPL